MSETIKGNKTAVDFDWFLKKEYRSAKKMAWMYDKTRLLMHKRYRISNLPFRSLKEIIFQPYLGAIRITEESFKELKKLSKHSKPVYEYGAIPRSLLIYGEEDKRLGYTKEKMEEIKEKLGEEAELIMVPGRDHNFKSKGDKGGDIDFKGARQFTKIKEFLA